MENKTRYDWLDFTKGIGIILVVWGHTMFPIHAAIDVFHMPLFFFLAGLTVYQTSMSIFIIKKTEGVLIPFIFFSIISSLLSIIVPHEGIFNGPLWFLQTLFVALIITQLTLHFCCENRLKISLFLLLTVGVTYLVFEMPEIDLPFYMNRGVRATTFVLFGYLLKDSIMKKTERNWIKAFCFMLVYLISFGAYYIFYPIEGGSFVDGEIASPNLLLFYVAALSATLAVIYVSKAVNSVRIINWLGRNSLIIMCVHFPLIELMNTVVSQMPIYTNGNSILKIGLSVSILLINLCFGSICAILCKKFIPQLTAYKRNFL